jgi:hypothetical protein
MLSNLKRRLNADRALTFFTDLVVAVQLVSIVTYDS